MQKIVSIVVFLVATLSGIAQKREKIRPVEYASSTRIITGKKKVYYPLSEKKAITIQNNGGTELKVYARARMEKKKRQSTVTIMYQLDGNDYKFYKTLTFNELSKKALYVDKMLEEYPSELKSFTIKLPKGTQKIDFFLKSSDSGEKVDVKFTQKVKGKRKDVRPGGKASTNAMIIGKKKKYYTLSKKQRTSVSTVGPGKLYVYARVKTNKGRKMAIRYVRNNDLTKTLKRDSLRTMSGAMYTSKLKTDRLSVLQKFEIKVPSGKHTYDFFEAYKYGFTEVYFEFVKEIPKQWKDVSATGNKIALEAVKNKSSRSYYRADHQNAVELNVTGPTQLRIMSRVEFSYEMHSDIQVMLAVTENEERLKSFKYSSRRSKQMVYANDDERIPGTLNKLYINIPEGNHTLKIYPENKDKSVLLRFSVPEKKKQLVK